MNNKKKVLIRNPDSGRLISIKGKKGKEVLKKLKDENKDIDYIVRIKGENYKKKDYLNQEESLKTTQVKENQEESLQNNQLKEKQENLEKQKNKIRVKIIPISHISHNPFYKTRSSFPNNGIPHQPESLGTILRFVQTNMKII
jgi:predicted NodU family carbamoyl transferase